MKKLDFCFATFCFGERYYNQTNRFILDLEKCEFTPDLIIVTDNVEKILNKEFTKVFNINSFNTDYYKYATNYYDFDFSVKRYSVNAAFNLGYNNIILVDTDVRVNYNRFNNDAIIESFEPNSILGPVTYNFSNQINTNSMLGVRLLEYEKYFNTIIDKEKLNYMPEDCIMYISIDEDKHVPFLKTWDECIKYKNSKPLLNIPAGNIDEMCFSALYNNISVNNNSNKSLNIIYPQHDKWY